MSQLRRSLFRQALFKVQNVEVTYMQDCRTERVLKAVEHVTEANPKLWWLDMANPDDCTKEVFTQAHGWC